ncbi:MAG: alpha/beta hydrolase, partial [Mycobacterium sp.]|nr:alpha/beta hydrolase [Mycobacterium sp.]
MLPESVRQWRDGGRVLSTPAGAGVVRPAPGDGPPALLLHGFPSRSY